MKGYIWTIAFVSALGFAAYGTLKDPGADSRIRKENTSKNGFQKGDSDYKDGLYKDAEEVSAL